MEIPVTQLPPGDPRLVDAIVGQLKSKGIFDRFRKECLADVDTKPAFLNLRQRVDGQVKKFLDTQTWKNDLNKNQLRDGVRKNIQESGILDSGIDAIINQVVNPKIKPLILPLVEDTVYTFLQIEKPKREIQEYDSHLQPPPHEQKPFYAQHQPLMPPPYPPYSLYEEIPHPYYSGPEPPKPRPANQVSPKRDVDESINDESSISAESEISFDEKPPLDDVKKSAVVAAATSGPTAVSEILPMETDVISSGEDDILARTSPDSATSIPDNQKGVEQIEMAEDNAVDSFDTARGEADTMTTAVEKLSIQENVPQKEMVSMDSEMDTVSTGAPPPSATCLPLFDSRTLDSISSNTSGLSFSPPSGAKSPTPQEPSENAAPPVNDTSSTCKSIEELRSTQSTPLVDEKSPICQPNSASSSEENSKPWMPCTLPKDLPSAERITIASFGSSFVGPSPTTAESARVIEGASPVSTEDSQGSLGNTSSSIDEASMTTPKVENPPPLPLPQLSSQYAEDKGPRSDKSEGEITTSVASSNSNSSSSSSPENSSSRNSPAPRSFEKEHRKSDSHHHSSRTSHRERSRDSTKDRSHRHSHKSKDDRERRRSKDSDRNKSSSRHDDHATHRDRDKHHSRRDKDDDKDRDRSSKGPSYSSGSSVNPTISSEKTSSTSNGGSKDKNEQNEKSSNHKSHSSSHSKSRSSSHSHSSSSHSRSHSSTTKSSKSSDRSSLTKSESKQEGKSRIDSKDEKLRSSDSTHQKIESSPNLKDVSKLSTSQTPSSGDTNNLKPKTDKKSDEKSDSKTRTSVPKVTSIPVQGVKPKPKRLDEVAGKKVMKVSILKEDTTFGLHLLNQNKNAILPKPNTSRAKLAEKKLPPPKTKEEKQDSLKVNEKPTTIQNEIAKEIDVPKSVSTPGKSDNKPQNSPNPLSPVKAPKPDTTEANKNKKENKPQQTPVKKIIPTSPKKSDEPCKLSPVRLRRKTKRTLPVVSSSSEDSSDDEANKSTVNPPKQDITKPLIKNKENKPPIQTRSRKLSPSPNNADKPVKMHSTNLGQKRATKGTCPARISITSSEDSSSSDDEANKATLSPPNKKDKENKPPVQNDAKKLVSSPKTADKPATKPGRKRVTKETLPVSSSEESSTSDDEDSNTPVLKKVTIPLFHTSQAIIKSHSNDQEKINVGNQNNISMKPLNSKRKRGKVSAIESSITNLDNDSSSSCSPSGDAQKGLFDSSDDEHSDFEGFSIAPKVRKKRPPPAAIGKKLRAPVKAKSLKAKPLKKSLVQRVQQELVVVCDTGSDSSDMEMSVVKFCQNASSKSTHIAHTPSVSTVAQPEEVPLAKILRSNDFEGFADEGFEDSVTSGCGADQKLRDYLARFISESGSLMHLDDFLSLDSDEDDVYEKEISPACTVFSSRSQTSGTSSAKSVIEEITNETGCEVKYPQPTNKSLPLFQKQPEDDDTLGPTESPEKDEESREGNILSSLTKNKTNIEGPSQNPTPSDTGSEASPSSEMVPPPLTLYEMESRIPLKKRKLSGSFSPATSPAKVHRKITSRAVTSEERERTPLVDDFISKDLVINTYSILTPEEDRSSTKDYEMDLSQRENSYSPLSPASDSSAEELKSKLKINAPVANSKRLASSACPSDS